MEPEQPSSTAPMGYERFLYLWTHPVYEHQRNWVADLEAYRDGCVYLMSLRRPHFVRMPVPTYLQAALISAFLDGHVIYVADCPSGERIRMTIWHPARSGEEPPA